MGIDELINQLVELRGRDALMVLTELEEALALSGEITPEISVIAAYIAGVEDALTGTGGRPEYDLRMRDFVAQAKGSMSETGRSIGDAAMDDFMTQARDGG
ncbi:hypothetical protein Z946_2083 [Sulfitobacter noctilucicola]|uniref:Uncharacterized protein n=1 Tax=Sulfitobacter noctilucicola TaxID=1342301 RepID=A0A7W6Q2P7_9RHOB|nr:hypothetical protein [Sulfitobacter noctilucicola]KIN63220.1 hypothetical protein Z946_2083 [Sulfitobacter noctilucicola]MBB4172254.1 hypothetical protein [Sulfitobacter noctilucicola]